MNLNLKPNTNTGTVLRLKGKGAPKSGGHGDVLVTTKIVLPETPDADLTRLMQDLPETAAGNPRRHLNL